MDNLRGLMGDLASTLDNLRDITGWEYGAFVIRTPIGLFQTEVFTSQSSDEIAPEDWQGALQNFSGLLGNGYEIVGWIHVQSSALPSGSDNAASGGSGDWGVVNALINAGAADDNLVTYIVDDEGNLYEYTSDQEGTEETGAPINGSC